ncbi:MAG: CdaR family protein [Verrucomicrobiota bacterium]
MPLRESIAENFWVKLLSLCLAVLIYFIISHESGGTFFAETRAKTQLRDFSDLPITIMTTAEDGRGFNVSPNTVQVTVSGHPRDIAQLTPRDIKIFVDLTEVVEARGFHKRIQYSTPNGIAVEKVIPSEVSVIRINRAPPATAPPPPTTPPSAQ